MRERESTITHLLHYTHDAPRTQSKCMHACTLTPRASLPTTTTSPFPFPPHYTHRSSSPNTDAKEGDRLR